METLTRFRFSSFRVLRPATLIVCSVLLITMTTACGKKGPVRPKLDTLPEAPQKLTLQQQGPIFLLGWTIPDKNQDGGKITDLTGFRIKRLSYNVEQGCPTCQDPQIEVIELSVRNPTPGQRINKRIYWRDLDIKPGTGYRYAITPLTIGDHEGPAAMIHLAAQQPPPAPTSLQLEAGEAQVNLAWQAPALPAEMQLVGYNLYRRQGNLPFPVVPVNVEPLQKTRLLDRGLDSGRAYEYRVSALIRVGDQLLESLPSTGGSITPR